MEKEKFNKFILCFLFLQPIIDVLTSIQIRNNIFFISIGALIRGLFFLIILIYLIKTKTNRNYIYMFIIYIFLAMGYYFLYTKNNMATEFTNLIKIFYLPVLICFFNNYKNEKINDKLILGVYLIYLNLIIIPYIFGLGYNISEVYVNKKGYLGLFYSGNEISAIIISLLPIVINYIIKSKNYLLKLFVILETIIVVLLVGTKTLLLGFIIVLAYFILRGYKKLSKKSKAILITSIVLFLGIFVITLPKLSVTKNMKVSLEYYKINDMKSLMSYEGIDNIIFSKRLTNLENINKEYSSGDIKSYMYGIGNDKIVNIKDIEIDIFDIFYSIGIFGFVVYLIVIISAKRNANIKGYYKLSFVLLILISLFSGHVLLEPMVSIYLALLFIISKNNIKDDRKRILLVSNMYPSEKYKFYGSFVKNTKELLEENNYIVDKVVKYKDIKIMAKLFGYISFYIKSTIYGIINNYDYIYVHYISHSTLGVIIPKITSKDVKLVLNVHGNDVVADYKKEEKNVRKSRKYLKYADAVVVPSNYYKEVMMNEYGVNENIITVYPSGGVNTDKFVKKDKKESKKICGLKEEYKYVGYISRIEKNKGYDTFLKAIKELEKEDKIGDKKFLIVGAGSEEKQMHELIKELDILNYLEIRNMVSQEELVDIYNSLDLFVFPTYRKSESLGLVGLEAMACETFVVASNNYGPTDYLINKKNGLLFNPNDPIDLKNKILDYENLNNEQYKKIIKKARETSIKYDFKNTQDIILSVFK